MMLCKKEAGRSCVAVPCGTLSPSHPLLGLHLPICGACEGGPGPLLPEEGEKILLAAQYHAIFSRQWSLGAGNSLAVPRMGFPSAKTLPPAAHSWENHRRPHNEHLVPLFLWRHGSGRVHGAHRSQGRSTARLLSVPIFPRESHPPGEVGSRRP